MCGIIGYIGKGNTKEVLLNGLKALEYRGYDSAGVAFGMQNRIDIIKSVGKVLKLEEKIGEVQSNFGIAHTRWATNGEANEVNAHPHQVGRVTLVHNGIVENADVLKFDLKEKGYLFKSETDSEVVAALLDFYLRDFSILDAIEEMRKDLKGSYALGIIIDNDDELYALRKDSPLILGVGEDESFLASDLPAFIKYTNKYILLDEGEVAVLKGNNIKIYKEKQEIQKEVKKSDIKASTNDKNGYDHYMMKEIMEEPTVLSELINKYLKSDNKMFDLSEYDVIDIVACGSAMYAGLIGKSLIEEYAEIEVKCEVASEYRYKKNFYSRKTLVILVSQSGETADTIAAMRYAKEHNIDTLGIINNPNSTMARECDKVILTNAGVEVAVATTKAYILQSAVFSLLAYKTAKKKGLIDYDLDKDYLDLPVKLADILKDQNKYKVLAEKLYNTENCFFIGRGIDYAISLEGSLKLKEVSYIHSEAYQAGELKHGTISLVEEKMPVFCIITDKKLKDKTVSNLKETDARGAIGIVVTTEELDFECSYEKIVVPTTSALIQSLLVVPTLQLLAYYIAKLRDCDIDKPRNLAKSVTVE